jgi:hypothetical protein
MSKHLKDIEMSYFQHMKCALGYAKESGKAMIYFFIHAFLPDVWVTKGSNHLNKLLEKIRNRMKKNEVN